MKYDKLLIIFSEILIFIEKYFFIRFTLNTFRYQFFDKYNNSSSSSSFPTAIGKLLEA